MIMNNRDIEDKWLKEYIKNVDISEIEWMHLDSNELKEFYINNYYDDEVNMYVKESNITPIEIPLGMSYLSFNYINDDFKNLLGVVPNNIGKKTIVACLMYLDECYLFEEQSNPVTYILSVEVNNHFINKGIFKRLVKEYIKGINSTQHLFVSKQSMLGKDCKVFETIANYAKASSFEKEVLSNDYMDNDELKEIVCNDNYSYVKK